MWKSREIARAGAAIIATLVVAAILRLVLPAFDYFPPEKLVRNFERSWFVASGVRRAAMFGYTMVALVLMAVFFDIIQRRWPGRGSIKGLAFGTFLGIVWSIGFLSGWAFLETTLRAELLNGILDLLILAIGGWLIGLAIGRDVPRPERRHWRPWLGVLLVALGFVVVHTSGSRFLASLFPSAADLLLVPMTLTQIAVLLGLGLWAGAMFIALRAGLPFNNGVAQAAFFGFGVFGHSWTWFHIFFVIEFAGVLYAVVLVGLIGATGVFAGALAYEALARRRRYSG